MKQRKISLVVAVVIALSAILLGAWYLHRQSAATEQLETNFAVSPLPTIPDIIHATPGAPPIQPH